MAQNSNPSSSVVNSLTGPLHTITICSNDLEAIKDLYVKTLGMKIEGPYDLEDEIRPKINVFWDIPEGFDFQVFHLQKEDEANSIGIRLLLFSEETDSIHSPSASTDIGPYSLGFIRKSVKEAKALMKNQEYQALTNTHVKEAHVTNLKEKEAKTALFLGPDNVKCAFIEGDNTGLNLTTFIAEQSEEEIEFYTHVLDMQLIADFQGVSKNSASKDAPRPLNYRSSTLVSKKSRAHQLHLLSYDVNYDEKHITSLRIPQRGVTMYSFETKDIGEILARAHAKQIKVYRSPRKIKFPFHGEAIGMTLLSPSGFVVEVFSPSK